MPPSRTRLGRRRLVSIERDDGICQLREIHQRPAQAIDLLDDHDIDSVRLDVGE
jgi:hypothetical protein